jgi:hypothetical protein
LLLLCAPHLLLFHNLHLVLHVSLFPHCHCTPHLLLFCIPCLLLLYITCLLLFFVPHPLFCTSHLKCLLLFSFRLLLHGLLLTLCIN